MNEFELGQIVCTRGIEEAMKKKTEIYIYSFWMPCMGSIANVTGVIPVKKMLEVTTKL